MLVPRGRAPLVIVMMARPLQVGVVGAFAAAMAMSKKDDSRRTSGESGSIAATTQMIEAERGESGGG